MTEYRNRRFGFTLQLPDGWRPQTSLLRRLLFQERSLHFVGPEGGYFVVTPGPLLQKLDFQTFRRSFLGYLSTLGYDNVRFESLQAGGEEHYAACYSLADGRVHKKYSIVYGNLEFAITARLGHGDIDDEAVLASEKTYDTLVLSFRVE